jgi:hypothetical protein
MKTRYSSNSELAHIWANDPDSSVYKSANSLSCHWGKLFSYSTCIGQIVTEPAGRDTVIYNNASYSNSTSKHQNFMRGATRHYDVITLTIPKMNLSSLVYGQRDFDEIIREPSEKRAEALLVKASRARVNARFYYADAIFIYENLEKYASFFKLEYQQPNLSEIQEKAIEAHRLYKIKEKEALERRIIEQAEALEKWRLGLDVRNYFEVTALRIKDDEIQTTKGAKIPLDHAVKFWGLIKSWHEKGVSYVKDHHSIHLGNYSVNRFENGILTVGCHSIPYSEIENIAHQLHLQGA